MSAIDEVLEIFSSQQPAQFVHRLVLDCIAERMRLATRTWTVAFKDHSSKFICDCHETGEMSIFDELEKQCFWVEQRAHIGRPCGSGKKDPEAVDPNLPLRVRS